MKIFSDSPIDNAKHFNFDDYVETIHNIIVYSEISTPLSIAINGKWGSGKSSLMKTLRKRLDNPSEKLEGRKVRTVWFNAWKYSETDAMLASLVREIYNEIDRQKLFTKHGLFDRINLWNLKINERANKTQLISDLAKTLTLGLSPDLTKWQNASKYEGELPFFDKFQEYMRNVLNFFVIQENDGNFDDKKGVLVIFIDDLDRCSPKSVANILESINLFFDQKGCIFVFGLDIHLISKAINSHYNNYLEFSGHEYLKKMIQLQFDLPDLKDSDIKKYFEQELSTEDPLRQYIDLIITSSDRNPRKVKQSINSLKLMITLGNQIKGLRIEEELLIKWSILNFTSSVFINSIKNEKEILFYLQSYWRRNYDDFLTWVENFETGYEPGESPFDSEIFSKMAEEFKKDKKIREVLQSGTKEFNERNIVDCIYLSGIVPKNPKVTIAASKNSLIRGSPLNLYGTAIISENTVLLTVIGEGEYSEGKIIGTPDISSNNTWSFRWNPGYSIEPGTYIFLASDKSENVVDTLVVSIEKGAVTIVASGTQSYYIGEIIRFSGTCTARKSIFLSIAFSDPHLPNRKLDQISLETVDNDPKTFLEIKVRADNTFEYEWDTSKDAFLFSAGTYTIYACEGPFGKNNLENKAYGTVSIILKKPFVSATASQSTIAQGDRLFITGTAEGKPKPGVQVWIFGPEHFLQTTVKVNEDASFIVRLEPETKNMEPGQYFVIVQHPMQNNEFDVFLDSSRQNVLSNIPKTGTELFSIDGPKKKKGADAAMALVEAINNPNIDDTYTKLQFLVETPIIQISHINGRVRGEPLSIEANTNLAVDDVIILEIKYVEPDPVKGIPQNEIILESIIKVIKGDSGLNRLSISVDTTSFQRGKYSFKASARTVNADSIEYFEIF